MKTHSTDDENLINDTQLKIHSSSSIDFAMKISFIKGAIHGFNRMLNYSSKSGGNVILYEQIEKVKENEINILEENLEQIKKTVKSLYIETKDKLEFIEFMKKKKDKSRIKKIKRRTANNVL